MLKPHLKHRQTAFGNQSGAVLVVMMVVLGVITVGLTYGSMKVKNGIQKAQLDDFIKGRDRMADFLKSAIDCEATLRNALGIASNLPLTSCSAGTEVNTLIYFGGVRVSTSDFAAGWKASVTCGQSDLNVHISQVRNNALLPHPVFGVLALTSEKNKISDFGVPSKRNVEICPQYFGRPDKATYRVYTLTNNTLQRELFSTCDHSITDLPTTAAEEERGGGACVYPPVRCDGSLGLAHRWYDYPPPPSNDPDDPIKCRLADGSWHIGCQLMRATLLPNIARQQFPGGWQKFPAYPPARDPDTTSPPLPPNSVASQHLQRFPPRSFADDGVDENVKPVHVYPRTHLINLCNQICWRRSFVSSRPLSCWRNDAAPGTTIGPLNLPANPRRNEYPITDAMGIVPDRATGEVSCVCFK